MAQPLVSVIVPTYNSAEYLEACLASINNQSYKNIELIVVDNGSKDKTKEIARAFTAQVYDKGPERSAQRNFGVSKSKGNYVLIIDSDMELTKDVVRSCVELVQKNKTIKAVTIPEESFGEGFWAQCKKLERSYYVGVDWIEAARFFDKQSYLEVGGYDELMTGGEDFDLPQRMRTRFGAKTFSRIQEYIHHNERRLSLKSTLKKKYYYAQMIHRYKSAANNAHNYKRQASIMARFGLYFSRPGKLLKDPLHGAGMLFMKVCEFGVGGLGYIVGKVKQVK